MKKKIVSGMILTLLLIGMLTLAFNIQTVRADWTWTETIYIRADGSVDPDTAPILSVDNITYTLTDNIVGDVPSGSSAIIVERDNIVVNGTSHELQGTGASGSKGIDLSYRSNVTIKNVEIKNFTFGIWLEYSSDCTVSGNSITNNVLGIDTHGSSNNTISGNNITNNGYGISLMESSNYNTISVNSITENNWVLGILLSSSSDNVISGNNITENDFRGIGLLESSNYNTISVNNIENNGDGIWLLWSSNNTISVNNIENNGDGIWLCSSSNYNTVSGNNITNNENGILLDYSSNNIIYHNNFVDNSKQVYGDSSMNVWDDDYPSGGNYWSDYMAKGGYDADGDGIGDIPYVINANNQDRYPLMEPWSPLPRTIGELKTEIEKCWSEGEIDNKGIVKSLIAKLNVAQKLVDKGKVDEAKSILAEDFIPQVQNLTGIHITPEAADILIQSAEYILSNL